MKKIISILLLITTLCCLTACSKNPVKGTWTFSLNGTTSTLKFSSKDKVVWTIEENGEKKKCEGKYVIDEEKEKITIALPGRGLETYDLPSSSLEQIDFFDLPHRRK